MIVFCNWVPKSVKRKRPIVVKHGNAGTLYEFGIDHKAILGVQPVTLRESWRLSFESGVKGRNGLPNGEALGPRRAEYEMDGYWVGGNVPLDSIVRSSFTLLGRTYFVKDVQRTKANREFVRVKVTGTSEDGVGNVPGSVVNVGAVFGEGPSQGPEVDSYGVWSDTVIRRVPAPVSANSIPQIASAHPRYGFMKLQSVGQASVREGYAEVPCLYRGLQFSPGPILTKLDKTSGEEPLPSHPRYANIVGLDKAVDLIRAIMRGDARLGLFPGAEVPSVWFTGNALELYKKMASGKEAYFAPGQTFSWTQYASQKIIENESVPRIETPVGAPTYTNRTWLYTGAVQTEEGPGVVRIERTALLSALGGWDVDIYH